jgi:hypothetical protein
MDQGMRMAGVPEGDVGDGSPGDIAVGSGHVRFTLQ